MHYKKTGWDYLFISSNTIMLCLLSVATIYPIIYVLSVSLSTPADMLVNGFRLFPERVTWQSYQIVIGNPDIFISYRNTIVRTLLGTSLTVLLVSMTAYPLSRKSFPHRKFILFLFVFSMMFNGGLIPKYLLIKNLGLLDSIWSLVLPTVVGAFYIIVVRNYFSSIHEELLESARMDGASEAYLLFKIVIPLSLPVLSVISLWSAVWHWNAWFDALIYINDSSKRVLQTYLRSMVIERNAFSVNSDADSSQFTPETLRAAAVMFVSFPILMVYPFIQRYFVKGVMLGSVKG